MHLRNIPLTSSRKKGLTMGLLRNGVAWFGGLLVLCYLLSALVIRDTVFCVVEEADVDGANGYYSALNGVYWKRG